MNDTPSCYSMGWRGYMLGNGMIWYDMHVTPTTKKKIYIKSINNTTHEPRYNNQPIAWFHGGTALAPACFIYSSISGDNFQEIAYKHGLSDQIGNSEFEEFSTYPAKFIGHKISLSADNGLFIKLDDCIEKTSPYVIQDHKVSYVWNEYNRDLEDHYIVIAKLPINICESKIKNQALHGCYVIKRSRDTGGTIGAEGNVGLYTTMNIEDEIIITPLQYFGSVNNARNFIDATLHM
jgi:hypothetical protein